MNKHNNGPLAPKEIIMNKEIKSKIPLKIENFFIVSKSIKSVGNKIQYERDMLYSPIEAKPKEQYIISININIKTI